MRAHVILLIFLGAVARNASAANTFQDTLKRAKEEAGHIVSSLQDKERMQAKLAAMRNDLADIFKMTSTEAQRVAEPYVKAGQQSWDQFRARMEPAASRAQSWLKEQRRQAVALHMRVVEGAHAQVSKLPQAQGVQRKHVDAGLLATYSGVVALLVSLLLRRVM